MHLPNIKRTGIYIALIVAITLSALHTMNFNFFEVLEAKTLDVQFKLRGPIAPGPETVIATIDEMLDTLINRTGVG